MNLHSAIALKQVNDFRYLESMVTSSLNDLKRRKALGWSAFWSLHEIWCSLSIPLDLKLRLFRTTCLFVLVYVCETWIITKFMDAKLNAFATSCYRTMLNMKRLDNVLNAKNFYLTGTSPLLSMVMLRQLKFLGHILRMEKDEPANNCALYEPSHGKRPPGRPRRFFPHQVQEIDPNNYLSEDDIVYIAAHFARPSQMERPHVQSTVPQPTDDDECYCIKSTNGSWPFPG